MTPARTDPVAGAQEREETEDEAGTASSVYALPPSGGLPGAGAGIEIRPFPRSPFTTPFVAPFTLAFRRTTGSSGGNTRCTFACAFAFPFAFTCTLREPGPGSFPFTLRRAGPGADASGTDSKLGVREGAGDVAGEWVGDAAGEWAGEPLGDGDGEPLGDGAGE